MDLVFEIITDQSSIACCCFSVFVHLSLFKKGFHGPPIHDRGSMDPVHESGPWTRSK